MRTAKARPSRWHLTEVLKPRVPMRRMVFHEITRQAIEQAVKRVARHRQAASSTPRRPGASSTACSATRCPRCCGARSRPGLSAGRVQSPAVRLVVERERERMAFVAAGYWDLQAAVPHRTRRSRPASSRLDDARVATGKDFDATGRVADAGPTTSVGGRRDPGAAAAGRRPLDGAARFTVVVGRREALPPLAQAAVHHLDPPAGGRPQAAA